MSGYLPPINSCRACGTPLLSVNSRRHHYCARCWSDAKRRMKAKKP
jgi:hypothetical protein